MALNNGTGLGLGADAFTWSTDAPMTAPTSDPAIPTPVAPAPRSDAFTWDTGMTGLPKPPSALVPLEQVSNQAKERVEQAAAAKQFLLSGRETQTAAVLAQQNGNDLANVEFISDIQNMSYPELLSKYGPEVANNRGNYLATERAVEQQQLRQRTGGQIAADFGTDVASGLVTGLGSMVNLGAGLVSDKAGIAVAEANNDVRAWFDNQLSDVAQGNQVLNRITDQLDTQDNQAQYERDLESGRDTEFWAGVKNVGRNFLDVAGNVLSDPSRTGELTAEGIGNLLGTWGMGGIAARLGAKVLGPKLINGIMVGAMEGGDAYSQAVQHVMDMTLTDLQDSDAYKAYLAQGATPQEAREAVAGDAGQVAALIQVPLSGLAGHAIGKFEQNPLGSVTSLRHFGEKLLSEGAEETFQEGMASLSSNIGVRTTADRDQSLIEGVGESGAMGLVGGLGMAGAVQAAPVALQAPGAALRGAANAVLNIGAERAQREEDANPVSNTNIAKAAEEAQAALDTAREEMTATQVPAPIQEEVNQEQPTEEISPVEENPNKAVLDTYVQSQKPKAWVESIQRLQSKDISEEDSNKTALQLMSDITEFENSANTGLLDYVDEHGTEAQKFAISKLEKIYGLVKSTPSLMEAFEKAAAGQMKVAPAPIITAENIETPEVQDALNTLSQQAVLSPASVDRAGAEMVMNQIGDINTPNMQRVRRSLKAAVELLKQTEQAATIKQETAQKLNLQSRITSKDVYNDIHVDGNRNNKLPTLGQRVSLVQQGVLGSNMDKAHKELDGLREFALTFVEKVRAMDDSRDNNKKGVFYGRLTPQGWAKAGEKGATQPLTYHKNNSRSHQLYLDIQADANAAIGMYNKLVELYPELGALEIGLDSRYEDTHYAQKQNDNQATETGVADDNGGSRGSSDPVENHDSETSGAPVENDGGESRASDQEEQGRNRETVSADRTISERSTGIEDQTKEEQHQEILEDRREDVPLTAGVHVFNKRIHGQPEGSVYIGRPSKWGNPFSHLSNTLAKFKTDTREEAIEKFEAWFRGQPELVEEAKQELKGKDLVCWCAPKACHGHILARIVNERSAGVVNPALLAEIDDVSILLDLLGVEYTNQKMEEIPFEDQIVSSIASVLVMYESVSKNEKSLEDFKDELKKTFSWYSNAQDAEKSQDRIERAKKSAIKHGKGNIEANYLIQLAEELVEVRAEIVRGNPDSKTTAAALETQKRQMKMLRFGEDTIIKGEGEYKGLTNKEAYEKALNVEGAAETVPESQEAEQKAQVAEQEATPATASEAPKRTVKDIFPKLIAPKVANLVSRVWNAFKPSENKSRWLDLEDPINAIREALKDRDSVVKFSGNELANVGYNTKQKKAAKHILDVLMPAVVKSMNDRLNDPENKAGRTFVEILMDKNKPLDVTGLNAYRNTALAEFEDGKFRYNENIIQAAVLAGLQYLMDARDEHRTDIEDSDLESIFRTKAPTYEMRKAALSGKHVNQVVHEIGRKMKLFVGLDDNKDAPISDTQGIFDALALEFIQALEEGSKEGKNRVQINRNAVLRVPDGMSPEQYAEYLENTPNPPVAKYNTMTFEGVHKEMDDLREVMNTSPNFFEILLVREPELTRYIGQAPEKVTPTQMRNKQNTLTAQEKRVVKNVQNMDARLNMPMVQLMEALGENTWIKLLGYTDVESLEDIDIDGRKVNYGYNKNHLESLKGKNNSLEYGWRETMAYVKAVKAYAGQTNTLVQDVKFFFEYGISKVGRLQQIGFGPQGDKTAREMLTYTRSTLDLSDQGQDDLFWLTVAQSVGIKTEKETRLKAVQQAKEMFQEDWAIDALAAVNHLVRMHQPGTDAFFGDQEKADFEAALQASGKEMTPKFLHAILAVARYDQAKVDGTHTAFDHNLALEADGKTDGPINAMVNFIAGEFTVDQIDKLAMGGLFIGAKNKTLNDYYKEHGKATKDLYIEAKDNLSGILKEMLNNLEKSDPPVHQHMLDVFTVMRLLGKVSFDGKDLKIDRGATKNPLTISVYGSGINGLSSKITNEVLDAYYEAITHDNIYPNPKNHKITPEIKVAMDRLINSKWVYSSVRDQWSQFWAPGTKRGSNPKNVDYRELRSVTLTNHQRQTLVDNIKVLYAQPMKNAIDEMMGSTIETMKLFQQTTQVQAHIALDTFMRRAKARRAELLEAGVLKGNDQLSRAELDKIIKEIDPLGAIIRLDNQTLNLGTKETSEGELGKGLVRGMNGEFALGLETGEPSLAGVKAAPFMVIATGDGQMVLNIYDRTGGLAQSLPVFDGIEMSAHLVDEQSRLINEAVLKGWQENPSEGVLESFTSFLKNSDYFDANIGTTMDDEMRITLTRILFPKHWLMGMNNMKKQRLKEMRAAGVKYPKLSNEEIREIELSLAYQQDELTVKIYEKRGELENLADSIKARKQTLASVQLSVDHMASGEKAVTQDGEVLPDDPEKAVERLNEIYEEKLTAIRAERVRPAVEPKSEGLIQDLKEVSQTIKKGNSIRNVNVPNLVRLINENKRGSEEQLSLLRSISKALGNDAQVYFGPRDKLTAFRNRTFPHLSGLGQIDRGQYDPRTNTLFVVSGSTETLLHELVHAATFRQVYHAYLTPSDTPQHTQEAVERLEALMTEFLDMAYDTPITDLRLQHKTGFAATIILRDQIAEIFQNPNLNPEQKQAMALNEFMAWSLSNQHLIDALKKQKVQNPLARLAKEAMRFIRNILGSVLGLKIQTPRDDLYSNIRFNTEILMDNNKSLDFVADQTFALNHTLGTNSRLTTLTDDFLTKMNLYTEKGINPFKKAEVDLAQVRSRNIASIFEMNGYSFTAQERMTFQVIQTAMATAMEMDKNTLLRAQELYTHVMDQLSEADFQPHSMAKERFAVLTGINARQSGQRREDKLGRTPLLASFLAMAQVDSDFRALLDRMALPKAQKPSKAKSMTENAESVWDQATTFLGSAVFQNRGQKGTVAKQLDSLTAKLAMIEDDTGYWLDRTLHARSEQANDFVAEKLQQGVDKSIEKLDAFRENLRSKNAKAILKGGEMILSLMSHHHGKKNAEVITSALNNPNTYYWVRNLFAEIRGATDENIKVVELVNKVRAQVSALRQDYREIVPQMISEKFSRRLKKEEWTKLYQAIAKTDLPALVRSFGQNGIDQVEQLMRDDVFRNAEIARLEAEIATTPGIISHTANKYKTKAQELATWMLTGKVPAKFLRNAYAIAHLYGEKPSLQPKSVSEDLIRRINELTTLYAIKDMDAKAKSFALDMFKNENQGMDFMLRYMAALRSKETHKSQNLKAVINHYKGKLDVLRTDASNIIVADDSEFNRLRNLSYERIGDYKKDRSDFGMSMGYYLSPVAGRATFNQGVMQTVQQTMFGVDEMTGYSVGSEVAGRITHPADVAAIQKRIESRTSFQNDESYLMPVYDGQGNVIAYERSLDPEQMHKVARVEDLSVILGAWAGRQEEEKLSEACNRELVHTLRQIWGKDQKTGKQVEYVNVADPKQKDRIIRDIWNIMPKGMKNHVESVFGPNEFWVRWDMLENALGYRQASVGDAFTGLSRLNPKVQKTIRDIAINIFGKSAYAKLVNAERFTQNVVSEAKVTIVIKSGVVAFGNIVSNLVQLYMRGVPLSVLASRSTLNKIMEANQYLKNKVKKAELEAQIYAHLNDKPLVQKLRAEMDSLTDADRRMSIWPLIEGNQFNTISEGLTDQDKALSEGGFMEYLSRKLDEAPEGVRLGIKNALITRDTELFKFMNRAVQYGDFISKSIYFDHLVQKGTKPKDAIRIIDAEYVNYNLLAGRSRDWLESVGLSWFWAFKIRSIKVATSILKENPLKALLWNMAPMLDVNNAITDNAFGVLIDGRAQYTLGPEMVTNLVEMNPIVQILK